MSINGTTNNLTKLYNLVLRDDKIGVPNLYTSLNQ